MSGSLSTFYSPRVPAMPSTASVPQEVKYHANQVTQAINGLPNFSIFSWSTPESNETAQYPALGFNLAPSSAASGLWFKALGSGTTGWFSVRYGEKRAGAHVHSSVSVQAISRNSATVVTMDVTDFDFTSFYDGVSKYVVMSADTSGLWSIAAHATWAPSATGGRQCDIYKNGVTLASSHVLGSNDTQSQHESIFVSNLTVGDFFQMVVTQSSNATLNLLTEPEHTYFEIVQIW